jgi:dTMP kinase
MTILDSPFGSGYYVIDGGEGAGKTTLIRSLREILPSGTLFIREPGGTNLGDEVRRLLLDPSFERMCVLAEFMLFWAARAELIEKAVRPALQQTRLVVSDRGDSSTFAYQIRGRKNERLFPEFESVRRLVFGSTPPDMYIFLDVDPEIGLRRIPDREDNNHFDAEKIDFHLRVRDGYREFLANRPHRVVDANRSSQEVLHEVTGILLEPRIAA